MGAIACERATPAQGYEPIDAQVREIDAALPSMQRDSANVPVLSARGTTLVAHYAGDSLRRLRAHYVTDTGFITETYYFAPALIALTTAYARSDAPLARGRDTTVVRWYFLPDSVWTSDGALNTGGAMVQAMTATTDSNANGLLEYLPTRGTTRRSKP